MIELFFHAAAPTPEPGQGGLPAEFYAVFVSALVIGIPSIVIALGTYFAASRARRERDRAERVRVDAEAYIRAKSLYESTIDEMRNRIMDLHAEVTRLNGEVSRLNSELREAKHNGGLHG